MNSSEKHRLQKNYRRLLEVDTSQVTPYLVENGTLTFDDEERIGAQETSQDRMKKLLQMLPNKGRNAYSNFRESLLESHDWLVTALDDTDMSELEEYPMDTSESESGTGMVYINFKL